MKQDSQVEYPTTFEEFLNWFQIEEDCAKYIHKLRWPDGFACPKCGGRKTWPTQRQEVRCAACNHQASMTAGTVFEDTRKPLRLWFHVMWLMMAQKTGVSAKNLCDSHGFGSYQTVWGWLQKLRSVMVRPGRELLHGTVEVDEAYVGGTKAGIRGRGADGKVLVAVAVECADGVLGRVRFHCVPDVSADSLVPFVCENVTAQSIVVTDGWGAYSSLSTHGFNHAPRKGDGGVKGKDKLLPHVHLVISLLKRWLLGTHQGAVTAEHLQGYLDEFSFRFNRRLSTHRGKLFYRLVQQAVSMRPPSIKEFYVQANHNL